MKYKFGKKDRHYWANALIALSQITFGVAWALIFAEIDDRKINLIDIKSNNHRSVSIFRMVVF